MSDATTAVETPATETATPPTGEAASVPTPAVEPAPSAAELMGAKLEALRLKNAERKARAGKLDERAKDIETREKTVAGWKDDPRAALLATGLSPKDALDELVRQAELDGTPAGEMAKLEKVLRAEQSALKAELAALKAERDAEREAHATAQATAKQAEAARHFVSSTLAGEKYAPLRALRPDGTPVYSEAELAQLGNHYADKLSADGTLSKSDPLGSIADAMLSEHLAWASRFGPVTTAATPAPDAAGKTVNGGRKPPNTLSNSGSEAAPKKALSFEERVERAKAKFA